jgi:hypothetical protein
MFGWDQRTALNNRDEAMARVAMSSDTSSLIYNAALTTEVLRFNKRMIKLDRYKQTQEELFDCSYKRANSGVQRAIMIIDRHLNKLDIIIAQDKLSTDLNDRMVAIQAIWDPGNLGWSRFKQSQWSW